MFCGACCYGAAINHLVDSRAKLEYILPTNARVQNRACAFILDSRFAMSASTKERNVGLLQFFAIIVVAVVLFLGWDFGRRLLDTVQLTQADALADQQLRAELDTNAKLKQLKADVGTDDWIEQYVRTNWHWTRENETIFVPAATPVATPAPPPAPVPSAPPPKPFWEQWIDELFGPAQGQ